MAGRRYDHTATLLADGRVLVTGGIRSTGFLDSTEIYDPGSNTWSPGPSLPSSRSGHAATLLTDGRVLVVGGNDSIQPQATAELYDPTANRWSSTNPMAAPRSAVSSILLKDGRVIAIGGIPGLASSGGVGEIFDPTRETWGPAGNSTPAAFNYGEATTILKDGRVLMTGGASQSLVGDAVPDGVVYDPRADRWFATSPMGQARVHHSASLLPDGRVLVAGGRNAQTNGTAFNTTEIFDVNAGTATTPPAATRGVGSSATGTPLQGLAARLPAAPLIAGAAAVAAVGLVAILLVRRRQPRRRRRSL